MVVSLPSNLTGVVRRKEVSDYFHAKAGAGDKTQQASSATRGRYFDETKGQATPLTDLFSEGQVTQ